MTGETFKIPVENVRELETKIEKLNKRAIKLNCPPIVVAVGEAYEDEADGGVTKVQDVTIYGEAPKLNGWQFIATLEHDEDGTIIRRIPTFSDEIDLSQYRTATPDNCDHCGYKRRRNDTYIVAYTGTESDGSLHEDIFASEPVGTTKQVGSNCLKDFTGHESPQQIARHMERVRDLIESIRGGEYSEGKVIPRYSTHEYLAHVAKRIRIGGWVSKRESFEGGLSATSELALADLFIGGETTVEDRAIADKVIEWAENLSDDDLNDDYVYNLHTVLKNGSLRRRQTGIAASGIVAYQRRQWDNRTNEFAGEKGERHEFTFTVEQKFDNVEYTTYVLRDSEGRTLKWSTQTPLDSDKTYHGSFKIKALNTHPKYGKQTMIHYPQDLNEVT